MGSTVIWKGIEFNLKCLPPSDKTFVPLLPTLLAHQASAARAGDRKIALAVRRGADDVSVYELAVHGEGALLEADKAIVERVAKFLLWMKGGYEISVCGSEPIAAHIANAYRAGGARAFDASFMSDVYRRDFNVVSLPFDARPASDERSLPIGGNTKGYRIGLDAGGSDIKISAVADGVSVFSEEIVWNPKTQTDPAYHYGYILGAMKKAKEKMPRVDAIGVSSAGVYVDNRCVVASLFIAVPPEKFDDDAKSIYIRAAEEIGAPVSVVNDGDVAALAGAMDMGKGDVLGVAMGTSEAAGYVDGDSRVKGWLNELAFAPVDLSAAAAFDEWSHDCGCGVKYLSQDGVIKLAKAQNIDLGGADATPAMKLSAAQKLVDAGDERAIDIFKSIGVYLGHSVALYEHFYKMSSTLVMGRVASGKSGDIVLDEARRVLKTEYPEAAKRTGIVAPDTFARRLGQSVAAASL